MNILCWQLINFCCTICLLTKNILTINKFTSKYHEHAQIENKIFNLVVKYQNICLFNLVVKIP